MYDLTLLKERHSVRSFLEKPIDSKTAGLLEEEIAACNAAGGLHIQLVRNEPRAFDSFLAHYGRFSGVTDYLALIGPKDSTLDEKCGYFGERLVLKAQALGLNSCWVALTYKKIPGAFRLEKGEKLCLVIALGYGKTAGTPHRSKKAESVSNLKASDPDWFRAGTEAALLAPTAMNQQKFYLERKDEQVRARAGLGPCVKIDLGIVKYHFEQAAERDSSVWL